MTLTRDERFITRAQRNNRIQVPVLIRWKYKLEPGEVFKAYVQNAETFEGEGSTLV